MDEAKKKLKKEWRDEQRDRARAAFPLTMFELEELFEMLEVALARQVCDHTRQLTNSWLSYSGKELERVHAWLDEHSGFCDCQIASNVKQHVLEVAGRPGDRETN